MPLQAQPPSISNPKRSAPVLFQAQRDTQACSNAFRFFFLSIARAHLCAEKSETGLTYADFANHWPGQFLHATLAG